MYLLRKNELINNNQGEQLQAVRDVNNMMTASMPVKRVLSLGINLNIEANSLRFRVSC